MPRSMAKLASFARAVFHVVLISTAWLCLLFGSGRVKQDVLLPNGPGQPETPTPAKAALTFTSNVA